MSRLAAALDAAPPPHSDTASPCKVARVCAELTADEQAELAEWMQTRYRDPGHVSNARIAAVLRTVTAVRVSESGVQDHRSGSCSCVA